MVSVISIVLPEPVHCRWHYYPVVVEVVQRAVSDGAPWQTLDLTTPVKDAFVEALFNSLSQDFAVSARIQFGFLIIRRNARWLNPSFRI